MSLTDPVYFNYNGVIFMGATWVLLVMFVLTIMFLLFYFSQKAKIKKLDANVALELNKNEIFSNKIKLLQQQLEQQKISFKQRMIKSKNPIFCSPCGVYMILDQKYSKAKGCSVYFCPNGCGEYVAINSATGEVIQRSSPHAIQ